MRRSVVAVALALAFVAAPRAAGAQSVASMRSAAWDEPKLEGSQFALAFDRWTARFEQSRIGLHLAAHPGDSTVLASGVTRLEHGDLEYADDATLIGFFEVVGASLEVAPVEACAKFLADTDGEEFVDILASADSALAERWVSAIEALVMSTVAAGPISPPADEARVQMLMIRAMGALPPEQIERWLRQLEAPEGSLHDAELCDNARTTFQLMAAVPAEERAALLRHSL